ncbi:MAG: hypothetical protein FWE44_03220 [Defluviitaleaceae bacterium]|nr:hypothetical protein [Defluviitaleaceae bacterium]
MREKINVLMKKEISALALVVFTLIILVACTNDSNTQKQVGDIKMYILYDENGNINEILHNEREEELTAKESPYEAPIRYNCINGEVIYIEGISEKEWVIPENIDWVSIRIICDDGIQREVIVLSETQKHGDIKAGSRVRVYWPINSPVFSGETSVYIAFAIATEDVVFELNVEQINCISQFITAPYEMYSMWPEMEIEKFALPNVYNRDSFEVLEKLIIAYGIELEEWPILLDDGTIMVPLQSAIGGTAMGYITLGHRIFDDGALLMNVSCGSMAGIRHIAVGSTKVNTTGGQMEMCTAPIVIEGIVYVPLLSFFRDVRPFVNTSAEIYEDRIEIFLVQE